MTVIEALWLLIINIVAWLIIHYAVSALCFNIPVRHFLKDTAFLRIAQKSYNKSHLHGWGRKELEVFAAETKRAELTHWLLMLPAPLFFLWNPCWAGWIIIAYALIANVPFIITQRYNRGRIEAILGFRSSREIRKKRGEEGNELRDG